MQKPQAKHIKHQYIKINIIIIFKLKVYTIYIYISFTKLRSFYVSCHKHQYLIKFMSKLYLYYNMMFRYTLYTT